MNNNQNLIDDAKAMIQFLEERPDFPTFSENGPNVFRFYVMTKDELISFAHRFDRATKRDGEQYFHVDRDFGKSFRISAFTDRSLVCRRVKVMREVEEWECPDSILNPDGDVPKDIPSPALQI